jgi:hypothetical protein
MEAVVAVIWPNQAVHGLLCGLLQVGVWTGVRFRVASWVAVVEHQVVV